MYRIEKNWEVVGYSVLIPILKEWETYVETTEEEFFEWDKNRPSPAPEPHFVTFEIPYELIQNSQELKKKLVDIRLAYSQSQTITKDGITYLSHIDITDVKQYLRKEEFLKFKGAGIKFPPEVEALFADKPKNEEASA